ncbi:MAG: siroheme synthase CysG [Hyphomicrobiaceae bacterium]
MLLNSRKPAEAQPQRMGALAKLPVFLDLAGKRAVVAGGTAAAAWKAELLAAAGADVQVYCPEPGAEMAALIARGTAAGRITHHGRVWCEDVFAGAAIALADAEDEAEAAAFAASARGAGIPVNVIDKPAFCQFQFGAIVNRSPVVIGISTDGGAPILGQAIRRRIETLLPPALAQWASLAKAIRDTVGARLAPGRQRRAFWERFADRAFGAPPPPDAAADMAGIIGDVAHAMQATSGRVTLVGAGPGDAELLTLKAVRALQSADVILYDDLVSDDVLELARREAKRMMVGKRGKRESCSQDDINALMIKLAGQGKHVVRLKSGDPMVFGRAGEEIEQLERAGIAVAVVPGITAASALAASLGMSLTHRDHAHSVRFVTGHSRKGELPSGLDWRGLADAETSLVVYMGGRTAGGFAGRLIAAGLPGTTPVIVATAVSRAEQTVRHLTLGALRDGDPRAWIEGNAPTLIGIGWAFARRVATQDMRAAPLCATA